MLPVRHGFIDRRESDLGWRGDAGDGGGGGAELGPSGAGRRRRHRRHAGRWIIADSGGGTHRSRLGFGEI
jgi:hypothetical protein